MHDRSSARPGVPEPEVLYVLTPEDGVGAGFLMEWLDGVTLGARIARLPELENARSMLAFQCGQEMARIHRVDVDATGLAPVLRPFRPGRLLGREHGTAARRCPHRQPMIDYSARWLSEQLAGRGAVDLTLVHNDFRNGNIMVDADAGLIAVLDWETAHIGDPMRDLGWMCTNSWRFGQRHLPVGGFGHYEDLFAGYENVAGHPVDRDRVQYWEVFGSFWWAVGCLSMADRYRMGSDATVERPGIGRRSSECQLDCVNLIIPGSVEFQPSVHELGLLDPDFGRRPQGPSPLGGSETSAHAHAAAGDMPRVDELLESRARLSARRGPSGHRGTHELPGARGRQLARHRVARTPDRAAAAPLRAGAAHRAWSATAWNLPTAPSAGDAEVAEQVTALRWRLVHALRDGSMPLDEPGLADYLRTSVAHQVAIDQPKYSAFRHIATL